MQGGELRSAQLHQRHRLEVQREKNAVLHGHARGRPPGEHQPLEGPDEVLRGEVLQDLAGRRGQLADRAAQDQTGSGRRGRGFRRLRRRGRQRGHRRTHEYFKRIFLYKGDVTNLAVDAITKEMKYESFAEQEELQREVGLENKGRNEVEDVKDKMVLFLSQECLQRLERQSDAKGQADIQQVNV